MREFDRISRLHLPEAEKLIETVRNKGTRLAVPGVMDLSDIAASAAKIVFNVNRLFDEVFRGFDTPSVFGRLGNRS